MNALTPRLLVPVFLLTITFAAGYKISAQPAAPAATAPAVTPTEAATATVSAPPTVAPADATTPPAPPARGQGQNRGRGPAAPRSGLRLQNIQLHDPWILADKDRQTYYLYSAASGGATGTGRTGTLYYKSKDLLDWDGPYICFTAPAESWANSSRGAWAPEVHKFKDKYYLFTTLHNPDKPVDANPRLTRSDYPLGMRSTIIARGDSPEGPFTMLKTDNPTAPANFMTIDGTLYVDPDGKPWMVYAHEWVQKSDGTFEALPLKDDLSDAAGPPIYLFKASDAPWINETTTPNAQDTRYVTDGCELFRTKDGHLLMIWSSYDRSDYVETLARSKSGTLKGPWEQLDPLVKNDSGHGMLFYTFDGKLMLCIGQPFNNQRAKMYDMEDLGDNLKVVKFREDLSGPPLGPNARQPAGQRGRGNRGAAPAQGAAVAPGPQTPATVATNGAAPAGNLTTTPAAN